MEKHSPSPLNTSIRGPKQHLGPCAKTHVNFSSAAIHCTGAPAMNLSISDGHAQHHLKHHQVPNRLARRSPTITQAVSPRAGK